MTKEMRDLCERNYREVESYVKRHFFDEDAEDIVQDVFLVALMKEEKLISLDNPTGWLINTAKHKILENKKKRHGRVRSLDEIEYEAVDRRNDMGLMEWLIFLKQNLSDRDCGILLRIGLEGRSIGEVAMEEGISQEKLRRRIKRIQERLSHLK